MRPLIIAAAAIAAGLAAAITAGLTVAPRGAEAQPLPHFAYCLFTGGDIAGFERCNYATLEQCLFDRRAEGGVCYSNPYPALHDASRRRIHAR